MKKVLNTIVALVVLAVCASCTTVRHTATSAAVDTNVVSYTVANLDVDSVRVTATTNWNWNPFVHPSVELIKTNTTAILLNSVSGDVLLEPQYIVVKRGFMRGGSVTVSGYPARFRNFHDMTPVEAEIFKAVPPQEKEKRHKIFGIF